MQHFIPAFVPLTDAAVALSQPIPGFTSDTVAGMLAELGSRFGSGGGGGAPGRGVTHTAVQSGYLLVTYSDGTTENAGYVLGEDGTDGAPGVGIAAVELVSGRLVVTLSNGTSRDLGSIVGPKGADGPTGATGATGAAGAAGRGVSSSAITAGRLVLTYTDGTTQDLGQVTGATGATGSAGTNGRGVTSSAIVSGRLVLTYTDGTTQDVGNVMGPAGDASNATYTAPYAGAVQRTLASKLAERVSVLDFGADPTGTTDSSAAFQAALDLAKTGKPVDIHVPAGTFLVAGLTFYSYTRLMGQGWRRTSLKAPNGANKDVLKSANADVLFGTNAAGGARHFAITNLTVDGNRANNTAGRGVVIYGYAFDLTGLEIRDAVGHGLVTEWFDGPAWQDDTSNSLMEAHVQGLRVQHCGGRGVSWNGPHDSTWVDVVSAENNYNHAGTNSGVYIGPKGAGLRGYNVHSWSWYHEYAFEVYGVNCAFDGGSADGFYTGGIYVGADQFQFRGTILQYVGGNAAPYTTCKGVILAAGVKDYILDVLSLDMKAGHIDFGGAGQGKIRLIGRINAAALQPGSVGYTGNPNQFSDLDIITNSAAYSALVTRPAGMNLAGIWNYQNSVSSWSFGAGFATRTQVNGVDVETWDTFQKIYAPIRFAAAGDAKARTVALKCINPGASVYALTADGAGQSAVNQLILGDKTSCWFRAVITAHRTDVVGDTASYVVEGHATRGTGVGSVTLSGVTVTTRYASDSGWAVGAVADTTYGAVRLTFSGAAGKTVRVLALVTTVEVSS